MHGAPQWGTGTRPPRPLPGPPTKTARSGTRAGDWAGDGPGPGKLPPSAAPWVTRGGGEQLRPGERSAGGDPEGGVCGAGRQQAAGRCSVLLESPDPTLRPEMTASKRVAKVTDDDPFVTAPLALPLPPPSPGLSLLNPVIPHVPSQKRRGSSRGARVSVLPGGSIPGGGVADFLSCAGDGDEPAPPNWFQFLFCCQKLVVTVACVSSAQGFQEAGSLPGVGSSGNRDRRDKVLLALKQTAQDPPFHLVPALLSAEKSGC